MPGVKIEFNQESASTTIFSVPAMWRMTVLSCLVKCRCSRSWGIVLVIFVKKRRPIDYPTQQSIIDKNRGLKMRVFFGIRVTYPAFNSQTTAAILLKMFLSNVVRFNFCMILNLIILIFTYRNIALTTICIIDLAFTKLLSQIIGRTSCTKASFRARIEWQTM